LWENWVVPLRIVKLGSGPVASSEGAPVQASPPPPTTTDPNVPSLAGMVGPGDGARILMQLFAERRTGCLFVTFPNGAQSTLCILQGEPVHLVVTDGGASLERRLAARAVLRGLDEVPAAASARHPIAALSRRADPISVLEALREEVRAFGIALLATPSGEWSFFDDARFVDVSPLTPVNPFGLVLEARRRTMQPQALLRLGEEIGPLYATATVELAEASGRLKNFTGGQDLAHFADGMHRVRDLLERLKLDAMMGGLVLDTLAEVGLLKLTPLPPPPGQRPTSTHVVEGCPPLHADARLLSALAAAPQRGGLDVLRMYMELKPERDPNVVLGVEGSVGIVGLERAYQERLAELDTRAIPPGPARPYVVARAEELRAKIERIYQARAASKPRAKTTSAYQILDRIGVGGMAEVFRGVPADDPTHFIAIKVVRPQLRDDAKFAQMFLEEARLARRIQHPNVVRVLTVGRGTNDLYLAMEYIDGLDFGELLRRAREQGRPLSFDLVARIVADACAGLHAAHTATGPTGLVSPIIHRDVSPQNILVSRTGEVKLSDFGIARAMDAQEAEEGGVVKGKIPYLAPELLQGSPASVRSDVYAMAMTVYAALGVLPFQRENRLETMRAILRDPLPPLSTLAPGVPPILDAILSTAAARNPEDRHASAQQMQLELEEILALRPPVDVAGWARSLAGARTDAGAPSRPTTQVRSSTGLTGVASTADAPSSPPLPAAVPAPVTAVVSVATSDELDISVDDF
jgi:serine/threonine protein kinase